MKKMNRRAAGRQRRKLRIRQRVTGSADQPRLSVFKSAKHLYAQIIDDGKGHTLASVSTVDKALRGKVKATVAGAKLLGSALAKRAKQKGIERVLFDRNGFRYHGTLRALADAAREGGLKF